MTVPNSTRMFMRQLIRTPVFLLHLAYGAFLPPSCYAAQRYQLRRQIRERRQYVYAKSVEAQERQTYERKQQLKDVLASGKPLPTELKNDAKKLGKELAFDDAQKGASFFAVSSVIIFNMSRSQHPCRQ